MVKNAVTLDRAGRVVIPAAMRKELGIEPGSTVLMRVEDGEIRLYTRIQAIRKVQAHFRHLQRPGKSIVEELREDRNRDLEAELGR